jgi:membrane-bound lytic murein transglycosylase A
MAIAFLLCGRAAPSAASLDDLDRGSLRAAIGESLRYLERVPAERVIGELPRRVTAREVRDSLLAFLDRLARPAEAGRERLPEGFEWVPSHSDGPVLVTGYYQPVLDARLAPRAGFRFPVYGKPRDLLEAEVVTLEPQRQVRKVVGRLVDGEIVPYFSRHEIEYARKLAGRGYEIAWVRDPVDLFFLHVQGSGILRLEDGRLRHVSYAASNGRPYRSIGRILVEQGKLRAEEVSLARLRAYLRENPASLEELSRQNERYIFFRFAERGPLGSLEVPLTAGRSVATDLSLFPKGALALLLAAAPVVDERGELVGWRRFSRLVLNQDAGAAITGPNRLDLFFGAGERAGLEAGYMRSFGRLYWLLKRG